MVCTSIITKTTALAGFGLNKEVGYSFGRTPGEGIAEQITELRNRKDKGLPRFPRQALDIYGARTRNRTGTPLRAGDFKSHASTSFAIRAVARCNRVGNI